MELSNARARIELIANATPTSTNVQNDVAIGLPIQVVTYPDADAAYAVRMILTEGSTAALDLLTNSTTGTDAWTAGTAQVETATAAGTITGSGNLTVVISGTIGGLPITLQVPVLSGDTASVWAEKVRAAMIADAQVSGRFAISGTGTSIVLTRLPIQTVGTTPIYFGNVSNLNISLDNGTCTGATTAATSTGTTSGVATSGCLIFDGDKDVWGDEIPEAATVSAILFEHITGSTAVNNENISFDQFESLKFSGQMKRLFLSEETGLSAIRGSSELEIEAFDGASEITINVILSN